MGQQTTLSSSSEGGEEAEPSAGPVVLRWNAQNHNNNHAHKVRNAPERVRMGFRAMVAQVYRVLPGFFRVSLALIVFYRVYTEFLLVIGKNPQSIDF